MTEQEAVSIVTLMKAAAAHPVDQDVVEYFITRLTQMDYQMGLAAATVGAGIWRRFPAWAGYMEVYRAQRAISEPAGEQRSADRTPIRAADVPVSREVPFWVKRWIAARFLYARFEKDQDFRVFPEEEPQLTAYERKDIQWMPDDEWVDEGQKVSDREVWGTLAVPRSGEWTF